MRLGELVAYLTGLDADPSSRVLLLVANDDEYANEVADYLGAADYMVGDKVLFLKGAVWE